MEIFKYELPIEDRVLVSMPKGAMVTVICALCAHVVGMEGF